MEVPQPPDVTLRDRETAFAEVEHRLQPWLRPDGLRVSPLGPGYSSDVDAYVTSMPDPAVLQEAGWLLLDDLLGAVGLRESGRWAVVVNGRVVGAADIYAAPPPDRVRHVLERCRRKGAGPRELAELEILRAQGHRVGEVPPRRPTAGARAVVRAVRRAARPRVVVAVSGVDGAGKSTLTQRLVDDLQKAGVPAVRVWARPGNTTPVLTRLGFFVKRLLREDPTPGLYRAGAGQAEAVRSRRGVVGAVWSALITLEFGWAILRQRARARGVVVFDRHVVDADVTLEVLYPGQRRPVWRVVSRVFPPAHLRLHLEVPPDVAVARKPDDPIGPWAVQRQIEEYERHLEPGVTRLDGQEDLDRLVLRVLTMLTELAGAARRGGSSRGGLLET